MTSRPGPAGGHTGVTAARGWSELGPRVASALVMALLALGTAWVGGPLFDLFWLAAGLAVLWEWMGLVGIARDAATLWPCVVALGVEAVLTGSGQFGSAFGVLLIGALAAAVLSPSSRRIYAGSGVVYAGVLVGAAPLLRQSQPFGLASILWLFAVVWGTDTMAFFGGRLIGGPKLAPRLSPSKTWSGFIVGVASGAILGLLVAPRSECPGWVFAAGLAGGAVAQVGDLFESSLKRRFDAKDAGSMIPGHGGLMDRLDGFIAASVLALAVGLWRFGPEGVGAGLLKW